MFRAYWLPLFLAFLTVCSIASPIFTQEKSERFRDKAKPKSSSPTPATAPATTSNVATAEIEKMLDVPYAEVPGVDAKLLSLDIYKHKSAKNAPVMIYVHGGGWKAGDKKSVGTKPDFFTSQEFILVSLNYRLIPQVDILTQLQDTANAIAWIHSHIAEYGGDPTRIHIGGHSAGAHHVAIVGTNERFLNAAGKDLSILKSVLVLDTQVLDTKTLLANGKSGAKYGQTFGTDEKILSQISPIANVAKSKMIPPFIISYSHGTEGDNTTESRTLQANAFSHALTEAGIRNLVVPATDRSHGEINARFGTAEDNVTQATMRFIESK